MDPKTLMEMLVLNDHDNKRDVQLIALEQLCMILLTCDNVDSCLDK